VKPLPNKCSKIKSALAWYFARPEFYEFAGVNIDWQSMFDLGSALWAQFWQAKPPTSLI
jgi:hypothetical protein